MPLWAEQAVFTSLERAGRAGYHVVARSPGVTDADARALAAWAPSHDALILDAANPTSVNLHPLAAGRCALARTCAGPPEYSGRGGRQLYTHALILDEDALRASGHQPLTLHRAALALGHLRFRPDPPAVLGRVPLTSVPALPDPSTCAARLQALGVVNLDDLHARILESEPVVVRHAGDRVALAECLVPLLFGSGWEGVSFSTSLRPSPARPYRLALVG